MSTIKPTIEPELKPAEQAELAHLEYFGRRIQELHERGLIPPVSLTQILEENEACRRAGLGRQGEFRAATSQALKLAAARNFSEAGTGRTGAAMRSQSEEAWDLEISLLWSLESDDEAVALCARRVQRFPDMEARLEEARHEQPAREAGRKRRVEHEQQDSFIAQRMELVRQHCKDQRDREAVSVCSEILSLRPDHIDALANAYCCQRLGDLEQALEHYEHLRRLQPGLVLWAQWEKNLRTRLRARDLIGPDRENRWFTAQPLQPQGPGKRPAFRRPRSPGRASLASSFRSTGRS